MCESSLEDLLNNFVCPRKVERTRSEPIPTREDAAARDLDECDRFSVSRFESDCSTGWDIQPSAVGFKAIECEGRVGLDEGIVRSYLDGSISCVGYGETETIAGFVDRDRWLRFVEDDCTRLVLRGV